MTAVLIAGAAFLAATIPESLVAGPPQALACGVYGETCGTEGI
jgi:hypothetical protein